MKKPTLERCKSCGSHSPRLERGHCTRCYKRWVESRPIGEGARCGVCGERRHGNLKQVELFGHWQVLCLSCTARALKIRPMPATVASVRKRLVQDHRTRDRRRIEKVELPDRRLGERRVPWREELPWLDEQALHEIAESVTVDDWEEPTEIRM